MNNVLEMMMKKYSTPISEVTAKNAVKQAIQEIVLCGLGRTDFYHKTAFNGDTALRIFHGLSRFSEDLDFSIDQEHLDSFFLEDYTSCINNEVASLGIPASFTIDNKEGLVKRGFIRGNCKEVLKCFGIDSQLLENIPENEAIKIKLEADATEP